MKFHAFVSWLNGDSYEKNYFDKPQTMKTNTGIKTRESDIYEKRPSQRNCLIINDAPLLVLLLLSQQIFHYLLGACAFTQIMDPKNSLW